MKQNPVIADNFDDALHLASNKMSISKSEWLAHGNTLSLMRQTIMSDYLVRNLVSGRGYGENCIQK